MGSDDFNVEFTSPGLLSERAGDSDDEVEVGGSREVGGIIDELVTGIEAGTMDDWTGLGASAGSLSLSFAALFASLGSIIRGFSCSYKIN